MSLNAFDVLLLLFVGLLVVRGVLSGLTRLLVGTGALIAAFMLAARFHGVIASSMARIVEMPETAADLGAYAVIFLGATLAGSLVASRVRRVLQTTMLGWADRLAGGAVGLVAAVLAVALVILPVVTYTPAGANLLRDSVLAPYVSVAADVANRLVPERLAERYRDRIESLRQYWRQQTVVSESDRQAL